MNMNFQQKVRALQKKGIPPEQAVQMVQAERLQGNKAMFGRTPTVPGYNPELGASATAMLSAGNAGNPVLGALLTGALLTSALTKGGDKGQAQATSTPAPSTSQPKGKATLGAMSPTGGRRVDNSAKVEAMAPADKSTASDAIGGASMIGAAAPGLNPLAAAGISAGGQFLGGLFDDSGKAQEEAMKRQEKMQKQQRIIDSISGLADYYTQKNAMLTQQLMQLGMR